MQQRIRRLWDYILHDAIWSLQLAHTVSKKRSCYSVIQWSNRVDIEGILGNKKLIRLNIASG